jgi:adenine phosphoribosyltransferase
MDLTLNRQYLRLIDVNTPGPRYDITPRFADPEAFSAVVDALIEPFEKVVFEYVAGIDALGFILGAAISQRTEKGFLPIRKGGKLPVDVDRISFIDYSGIEKSLEVRKRAIPPGAGVLIVDEWVETGAQIFAAVELIEHQGGSVIGIAAIQIDDHPATQRLKDRYVCHSVWQE